MSVNKYILPLLLSCCVSPALAQGSFSVESFGREENSVALKSVDRRMDKDGKACALIKIITLDQSLSVEGDVVGNVENKMNEYWVYVSPSAKSITISSNENGTQLIVFSDYQSEPLTPALQYSLVLKCPPLVVNQSQNTTNERSFSDWKILAESGDLNAQCELAKMYFAGKDVEQDLYEAKRWFAAAADKGHAESQYRLGNCFAKGQGVSERNYKLAVKYYEFAAAQNFADALYALGNCYAKGQGVDQDLDKAMSLYRKAAQLGHQGAKKKIQ